jgi:metal iron transporter
MRQEDAKLGNNYQEPVVKREGNYCTTTYSPYSVQAIRASVPFAIFEVTFSLLTFAFFVNCAILMVAASTFYTDGTTSVEDLFTAYDMLKVQVGSAAATLFAVSLLFSGQSSSIVATLAGQIVSEGFINWKTKPWIRRLVTRIIAMVPSLITVAVGGHKAVNALLLGSQATLSVLLPFAMFPLVFFTSSKKIMRVRKEKGEEEEWVDFSNGIIIKVLAYFICVVVLGLNIYLLVKLPSMS